MANIPFLNNAYFAAKVGIGVPTPNESLEVSGSILLSSRLKLGTGDHYLQQTSGDIYSFTTGKNIMYAGSAEVFRVDEAKLATFKGNAYFNSGLITTVDSTGSFYIDVNANNDYGGRNFRVLNNGTTYFNINADGDVGIGTTNPSAKLEVFSTTTNKFVRFRADNNEQRFEFYVGASGNASRMSMHNDAATETIRFASAGNSYFNGGNVGIGVTNPGSTLPNLFNSTTPKVLQISSATGSTDSGILIRRSDNATGIDIWNDSSNGVSYIDNRYGSSTGDIYFRVQTNGTPKTVMTITGDEKIGIGTTTPGTINGVAFSGVGLHVKAGTLGRTITEGTSFAEFIMNHSNASANQKVKFVLSQAGVLELGSMDDNGTRRTQVSILNSGNVGIGTTSPLSKLHVSLPNQTLGFDSSIFVSANPSDYTVGRGAGITFKNADVYTGGVYGIREANNWTGALAFYTHTSSANNTFGSTFTEKMRIDSVGNVGIGTTNPTGKLEIQRSQVTTQFDRDCFLRLHPTATTNSSGFTNMIFGTSTTNNYGVAIGGRRAGTGDTSSNNNPEFSVRILNDSITGTEVLNINTAGNATFTGNVILGTADSLYLNGTTGLRLLHDGSNALFINQTTGDFKIQNDVSDKDIIFRGKDGASAINALTLDMSDAGKATFNNGWSSDGQATEYTWRIPNTGSNDGHWYKIARVTSLQSTRFKLQMVGGHSYSDGYYSSEVNAYGQLNNDNNYDLIFYRLEKEFQGGSPIVSFGQVDVGDASTDLYVRLNTFAELVITASISNGDLYPDTTSTGSSTTPTNFVAALEQFGILSPTKFQGTVRFNSQILDKDNNAGTSGQLLSSTGSQVDWVDASAVIGGPYLPLAGGTMTAGAVVTFLDSSGSTDDRLKFGTGGDMQLFHDGTASHIVSSGSDLRIDVPNFIVRSSSGTESIIRASQNAAVELYYNNTKKFETTAGGTLNTGTIDSTGTITVTGANGHVGINTDSGKLLLGASYDLQIYHNATNSVISNGTGNLYIKTTGADKDIVFEADNGSGGVAEYLRLDGGITSLVASKDLLMAVDGDGGKIKFGASQDLQMYHNGADSYIENYTGNLTFRQRQDDGDIMFECDDGGGGTTQYFRVDGGAVKTIVSKNFAFIDGVKAEFGDSGDFQIYHSGSHSYIKDTGTGSLYLQTNGSAIYLQDTDGNAMAQFTDGGGSFLFYNGNLKLSTTNTGVTVTGAVTATTFLGELTGTINTATTAVTKANATNDTTVATTAFVQNLIGTIPAGLVFQGTWNAATNTPTLTSGSGTTGHFYIVSTDGSTNLDGITDWKVGDWAVFVEQGASDQWEKVDNSSVLDGSGTGQKVSMWSGSGTSNTLTNAPITVSGNNATFAGDVNIDEQSLYLYNASSNYWRVQNNSSGKLVFKQGTTQRGLWSSGELELTDDLIVGGAATFAGDVTIGNKAYPKINLSDNQGVARNFSVGTSNETFTVRNETGSVDVFTIAGTGNAATFAGNVIATDGTDTTTLSHTGLVLSRSNSYIQSNADNSDTLNIGQSSVRWGHVKVDAADFAVFNGGNERFKITSAGNVGIGTTSPTYKLSVSGGIEAGGLVTYSKSAGSLSTTGYAVAGLTAGFNGASAGFEFKCYGSTGKYQRIVYSCYGDGTTWRPRKVIDEGTNDLDVSASADGTTITFTFKARSSTQSYSPRIVVQATGHSINSTYA